MAERQPSRKEIRELIAAVRAGGWRVAEPVGNSNIWAAYCPCGDHLEHIHSTPNKNYAQRKLNHMKVTCWKEVAGE